MNPLEQLQTLDKNADVLYPRLLKKAGVTIAPETGEIIRDQRGAVFLICSGWSANASERQRIVASKMTKPAPESGFTRLKRVRPATASPIYGQTPCTC